MKGYAVLALIVAVLETGCSSGQTFSDVVGTMRISGQLEQNVLSPSDSMLSVNLTDASTGYPIDATSVDIKTSNSQILHADRERLGAYTAHLVNADKFQLLVIAKDRAAVIALARR